MPHDLTSRSSRGGFFVRLRGELSLLAHVTEVSEHEEQIINIVDPIPVGVAHTRSIHAAKVTQEKQHVSNGNLAIAIEIARAPAARIFARTVIQGRRRIVIARRVIGAAGAAREFTRPVVHGGIWVVIARRRIHAARRGGKALAKTNERDVRIVRLSLIHI